MDDGIIVLSSDSSAPNSPKYDDQKHSKPTSEDENIDSDNTLPYNQQCNDEDFAINSPKSDTLNSCSLSEASDILADLPPVNFLEKSVGEKNKIKRTKISLKIHELSDSDNSDELIQIYDNCQKEGKTDDAKQGTQLSENVSEKCVKRARGKNTASNEEKERKKAERLEKKAQKARDKILKQVTNEALRSRKPEECIKYVKVCLDQNLLSCEFGGQILVELQAAGMQYNIQTNSVGNTILWTRETIEYSVGEDMKLNTESKMEEEDEVVLVWKWDKVVNLVKNGDFLTQVQVMQTEVPEKRITLIIYGSKEYFKYQKTFKKREVRTNVLGTESKPKTNKKEANFESMVQISEEEWEVALTELQLFGFQLVMLDNSNDLAMYIRQFTKAVGEAPYKREKQEQDLGDVDWYGEGDSRDCVRVDKNGNGLLRLWQQQLCQFNNVGLETAQAIAATYVSPSALVRAYENCSTEHEAQLLLASIPVRRGVGPLTSTRSVGPELSKKIHAFFTCFDSKSDKQD